jgi:ubiquitin-protein ligase
MRFVTPVYHPNIDAGGRICLSVLKTGDKARRTQTRARGPAWQRRRGAR